MYKYRLIIVVMLLLGAASVLVGCAKDSASTQASTPSTGKGGSLARFTIARDHLYTVSNGMLHTYSLENGAAPRKLGYVPITWDVETIYPYDKYLFLGSRAGLFIYSIDTASAPRLVGQASHARACDPVVANDSVAFVTLKGGTACGPATSGLYVHNIKNITKPQLMKTVALPDPVGLGLQDNILYVSCGNGGLKVFNVSKPYEPVLLDTKKDGMYVDVIPYNEILICFVHDGIILYDITKPAEPVLVKKIAS